MRIAAVADLHGMLSHSIPECDVLAIVGDTVPLYSSAEEWMSEQELRWIEHKFLRWARRQPAKHVIIVPGNHDLFAWDITTRNVAYDLFWRAGFHPLGWIHGPSNVVIEGVVFGGNPWTPTIQNRDWAYSSPRTSPQQLIYLEEYVEQCDVLLSHGPPQGLLDGPRGERYGCSQLMHWMLNQDSPPQLTLCGHIHEERGRRAKWFDKNGTQRKIANVSICDENYSERGAKVQVFDL